MAEVQSATDGKPRFSRILLKLSGEALAPAQGSGLDLDALAEIALEIKEVAALGVQLAMVIGAGNYIRGSDYEARGMDRSTADQMGMLATVINALALQNALEHVGVVTRVLSAIEMQALCEPYIRRRAVRHLEKGRVVIFAAGTGNPYFTTDTRREPARDGNRRRGNPEGEPSRWTGFTIAIRCASRAPSASIGSPISRCCRKTSR